MVVYYFEKERGNGQVPPKIAFPITVIVSNELDDANETYTALKVLKDNKKAVLYNSKFNTVSKTLTEEDIPHLEEYLKSIEGKTPKELPTKEVLYIAGDNLKKFLNLLEENLRNNGLEIRKELSRQDIENIKTYLHNFYNQLTKGYEGLLIDRDNPQGIFGDKAVFLIDNPQKFKQVAWELLKQQRIEGNKPTEQIIVSPKGTIQDYFLSKVIKSAYPLSEVRYPSEEEIPELLKDNRQVVIGLGGELNAEKRNYDYEKGNIWEILKGELPAYIISELKNNEVLNKVIDFLNTVKSFQLPKGFSYEELVAQNPFSDKENLTLLFGSFIARDNLISDEYPFGVAKIIGGAPEVDKETLKESLDRFIDFLKSRKDYEIYLFLNPEPEEDEGEEMEPLEENQPLTNQKFEALLEKYVKSKVNEILDYMEKKEIPRLKEEIDKGNPETLLGALLIKSEMENINGYSASRESNLVYSIIFRQINDYLQQQLNQVNEQNLGFSTNS
jgi:hypothetical protein